MRSNPLLEDCLIEVMYVREERIVGGLYNCTYVRNILLEMLSRCPLYLSQGPAALERKGHSSELTHPPGWWKPSNVTQWRVQVCT